jgi:hypothetical protein
VERARAVVLVGDEAVRYEVLTVDARTDAERARDAARGAPEGHVIVAVPGHGQTVAGPRNLVDAAAKLSRSGIAWCIDPTPAAGGDVTEAQAIARIVRRRLAEQFPAAAAAALILGWSHGGSEALRAAREAPDLFPQYLGLCPTGLVAERPTNLAGSFLLEAARILGRALRRRRWADLAETLRVGLDFARGLVLDLVRSRSLRRLVDDVRWAGRKVPGPSFDYPGEVVLLLAADDTVIRWRDVLPGGQPDGSAAADLQATDFPSAERLALEVLPGDHMTPEVDAATFVGRGLALVGQMGAPRTGPHRAAP